MSANIFGVIRSSLLLAACAGFGLMLGAPADFIYSSSPSEESFVLHYTTNSIARTSSLFPSLNVQLYLLSFVFLLSLFHLNHRVMKLSEKQSLLFSSTCFLLLLTLQGIDYFLLSFLTGVLFSLLASISLPHGGRLWTACSLGVSFSFLIPSAAVFLAPAAVLLKLILRKRLPLEADSGDETFFWTLLITTWAFAYSLTPPALPLFPEFARVIPDDGLPGQFYSLIGSEPPLAVIDHVSVEAFYKLPSLILLAVILLLTFVVGFQLSLAALLPMVLVLIFDVCLPENLSAVGPLQSISRIVPGGAFISIVPGFFALSLLAVLLSCFNDTQQSVRYHIFSLLCCACVLLLGFRIPPFLVQLVPSEVPESEKRFISSISLPVYQTYGTSVVHAYRSSVVNPRTVEAEFFDLRDNSLITSLDDGAVETRWSLPSNTLADVSVRGIKVAFKQPTTLNRMALRLGPFRTDFPGSLLVKGSSDCGSPLQSWKVLFEVKKWLGPIEFTGEGYPYYGAENKVWFPLPDAREIQCLAILQPTVRGYFDWSIAEIVFH